MSEETKKCTKCGNEKSILLFRRSYRTKTSLRSICRECENIQRNDRIKDDEKEKERKRKSAIANKERYNESRRNRRKASPDPPRKISKESAIAKARRQCDGLSRSYVAALLEMKVADCTEDLIEMKRQQVLFRRLSIKLKHTVREVFK